MPVRAGQVLRGAVRTAPAFLVLRLLGSTRDLDGCQSSIAWRRTGAGGVSVRTAPALLVFTLLGINRALDRCGNSVAWRRIGGDRFVQRCPVVSARTAQARS